MTPTEAIDDTPAAKSAPSEPSEATQKHGLRRRLFVLGLVVVVASSGLVGVKVFSYQPLEFAVDGGVSFLEGPGQTLLDPDDRHRGDTPPFDDEIEIIVRYRANGRFSVDFDIRNRGDWEVVVSALPQPPRGLVVLEGVQMAKTVNRIGKSPMVPFHSFTLKPDDLRHLELTYQFVDCFLSPTDEDWAKDVGTFTGLGDQRVEYRVFRVRRSVELELPYRILFNYRTPPDAAACRGRRN